MNFALMENLYATVICILNKIPIFVVGKPGSSKTLTMQVLGGNLQGNRRASDPVSDRARAPSHRFVRPRNLDGRQTEPESVLAKFPRRLHLPVSG